MTYYTEPLEAQYITAEGRRDYDNMPDWDEIFRRDGVVFTEPHVGLARVISTMKERGFKRVLDLGCGTGRHLLALAQSGLEVFGFDSSPAAIRISKARLKRERLTAKLCVHRMEERFPYGDLFFDTVVSVQVIHHNLLASIRATIGEIVRVIKPRGLLFVTFPQLRTNTTGDDSWNLEPIEPGTYIPRSGPESGLPHHYFTDEEIPAFFDAFDIVERYVDDSRHNCVFGFKK